MGGLESSEPDREEERLKRELPETIALFSRVVAELVYTSHSILFKITTPCTDTVIRFNFCFGRNLRIKTKERKRRIAILTWKRRTSHERWQRRKEKTRDFRVQDVARNLSILTTT